MSSATKAEHGIKQRGIMDCSMAVVRMTSLNAFLTLRNTSSYVVSLDVVKQRLHMSCSRRRSCDLFMWTVVAVRN